ncbi:helix-turn-helix domain-containing protein [Neomoorella thermoacetica]|uniref:helix-turn-helix domain-containing protein n=1 Tax=Neomoorella thermoacetica TaxID=1525 RepID=UPI0030CD7FA5
MDNRAENTFDMVIEHRTVLPALSRGNTLSSGDTPGSRLRQARLAKNMTIRDLAAASGLTSTTIISLEGDKTKATLPHLRHLSQALNVPIYYLGCFENLPESTLGQRIKKARLFHGLTKEELSKVIGVDPKTLRSWEHDKQKPLQRYLTVIRTYLAILEK